MPVSEMVFAELVLAVLIGNLLSYVLVRIFESWEDQHDDPSRPAT